ncbi:rod shape-determining protein RodA [Candidatus Nomurabacteria bacterium]|nr:rod shape-determining protein RodA [Candidatus Nomurabacteria bacterium]
MSFSYVTEFFNQDKIKSEKGYHIDWLLFFSTIPILSAGLVTMNSFVGENTFFEKQIIWICISVIAFFILSYIDFRFLRRSSVVVSVFGASILLLLTLTLLGKVSKGAQSWFSFGFISFEPADFAKIALILVLAKYFSRRHIEIANFKHIIISGIYAIVPFILVALHPDFGSALIIFLIWFGIVMVSGISKKHLLLVFLIGAISIAFLWVNVFKEYQKQRIINFIYPMNDIMGTGYNAYQSTIAVGSGQILGKGLGYGTQSRLKFLPEYETDFVFAAFAEEWGFVGVIILFLSYSLLIWRILSNAIKGSTNFEILFGIGLAILFASHFFINVGMNIGLLPVTGINMPFMSYGGTYMLISFAGLGILMGMRRYSRAAHKDLIKNEFLGI